MDVLATSVGNLLLYLLNLLAAALTRRMAVGWFLLTTIGRARARGHAATVAWLEEAMAAARAAAEAAANAAADALLAAEDPAAHIQTLRST
jgi:hypothetical protein